ncbi:aminotransferase class I/II-fold pyridoxal phosphate-dependent enzyme [Candidatus Parcubacteria bacterium]|nr:aminotransferase class I/II-fold pyridoxal phosphate-dependent enzyme [Candidatus Parcubacteria bacterium]
MINKFKPISISLSPNVQKDDVVLALKLLFTPWKWKQGSAIEKLENDFRNYLDAKHAISFNSGRSSLYAILKALDLPQGSGVLMQAFTCNAVVNPILWAGLEPVYVDCADDFNIDIPSLRAAARQSRVLIVQHTFGLPANMDEVVKIAREHNLIIIEDCAHALGAEFNGKKVGTFGDVAFFSFSRDKVISSVYGGMATTNNDQIGEKLKALQEEFGQPSLSWTRQQIQHPVLLYYVMLPLYHFLDLGKIFLVLSQYLHILSKAVSMQEKRGERPDYFPKALPNALAMMAQNQFNKLEKFNDHRKKIAEFYYQQLLGTQFGVPVLSGVEGPQNHGNIFLRFAITHPKAHEIIYEAWSKENILIGDWYTSVIAPIDTQLDKMKYIPGMCPNAEHLAKKTLNLPTHINISMDDAKRIVHFLKKYT